MTEKFIDEFLVELRKMMLSQSFELSSEREPIEEGSKFGYRQFSPGPQTISIQFHGVGSFTDSFVRKLDILYSK